MNDFFALPNSLRERLDIPNMISGVSGVKLRKAVIPAAGFGTRFLPATKAQPKEMLPLVDKPIIQYVVEEAVAAGITDILIVTGRGKRAIEDHFDRTPELEFHLERHQQADTLNCIREMTCMANIHFVRQNQPLGLGHAILQACQHVNDEPFAVLLSDEVFVGKEPCLAELVRQYEKVGSTVVAIRPVPPDQVHRYGIVGTHPLGLGLHKVTSWVEKPDLSTAPSNLALVGRYIIDPQIFGILRDLEPGRNGEIQLTDGLEVLSRSRPAWAYEVRAQRYDVGDCLGYLQANVAFALARNDIGAQFRAYLYEQVSSMTQPVGSQIGCGRLPLLRETRPQEERTGTYGAGAGPSRS